MKSYYPKRPVKGFQDLEVYQKALAICVAVIKRIGEDMAKPKKDTAPLLAETVSLIAEELTHRVLKIPLLIATAHSLRFADQVKAAATLEDAMRITNLAVVYLEQYRDIYHTGIEAEFFEEQVKGLLWLRQKLLYLQRSWRKMITEMQGNEPSGKWQPRTGIRKQGLTIG